jgi:hypothetical protein
MGYRGTLMSVEQKHPADEIGKALARAGGILTLLSSCYDKSSGNFETGTSFVHESIMAIEAIVENATKSLARLYQTCDLSVVREHPVEVSETVTPEAPVAETAEAVLADEAPLTLPPLQPASERAQKRYVAPPAAASSYLGFFGPPEQGARLSDRLEGVLSKAGAQHFRSKSEELMDRPAESYDELLQKLTAVADQAAFQAHHSPAERALLPVLEGLRADLIKLRSVA